MGVGIAAGAGAQLGAVKKKQNVVKKEEARKDPVVSTRSTPTDRVTLSEEAGRTENGKFIFPQKTVGDSRGNTITGDYSQTREGGGISTPGRNNTVKANSSDIWRVDVAGNRNEVEVQGRDARTSVEGNGNTVQQEGNRSDVRIPKGSDKNEVYQNGNGGWVNVQGDENLVVQNPRPNGKSNAESGLVTVKGDINQITTTGNIKVDTQGENNVVIADDRSNPSDQRTEITQKGDDHLVMASGQKNIILQDGQNNTTNVRGNRNEVETYGKDNKVDVQGNKNSVVLDSSSEGKNVVVRGNEYRVISGKDGNPEAYDKDGNKVDVYQRRDGQYVVGTKTWGEWFGVS